MYGKTSLLRFESREGKQSLTKEMYSEQKRVTETKITNANLQMCTAHIPGYVFEYVPTPLASGGVGMFIDESFDYRILEKTSNEAFQVLWFLHI